MDWDAEMQRALEADGEKLRQMTGADHGPWFVLEDDAQDWLREMESSLWGDFSDEGYIVALDNEVSK